MPLEYTHRPVTGADKTAVVIGGTSGIGRAIALGFTEEGANVVSASRTESSVAETVDEVRERGGDVLETTCDVTDAASIEALAIYQVHRAAGAAGGAGGVSLGVVAAAVGGGCVSCGLAVLAALVGVGVANGAAVPPFDGLAVIWTPLGLLGLSAYHFATMEADACEVGEPDDGRSETIDAKAGGE